MRSHYLVDLLRSVVPAAQRVIARGKKPLFLHVGSAGLGSSVLHLWTVALSLLPEELRREIFLGFVDRDRPDKGLLSVNAEKLPLQKERLLFFRELVPTQCHAATVSVFAFSNQAERDFAVPQAVYGMWYGFTREELLDTLVAYANSAGLEPGIQGKWLAFSRASNCSSYVEEHRVRCATPALLERSGAAENVAMAVIAQPESLADGFLSLANFQPGIFIFRLDAWDSAGAEAIFSKFRDHRMQVGRLHAGNESSATDIGVAIPFADVPPQFSACDVPGPCGPAGSRWIYLEECLRNVVSSAEGVVRNGGQPTIVHIGSANLHSVHLFTDVDLHNRALTLMPLPVRQSARVILVDANSDFALPAKLRSGLLFPIRHNQTRFVNAMMTDGCQSSTTTMYRFGPAAERDFGVPWKMYETWLGPTRSYPLDVLWGYTTHVAPHTPDNAKWQKFLAAPNRSAYITERQVPCLSVPALLDKTGVRAEDVVMVVIDGERADISIARSFLAMPRWRPGYLQYELGGQWQEQPHLELVQLLRQHGLEVGRTYGNSVGESDANNVIAVPHAPASPAAIEPEFSVCDQPAPCGPKGKQWHYFEDILLQVVETAHEMAGRPGLSGDLQQPVILQIGSAVLDPESGIAHPNYSSHGLFGRVVRRLPLWMQDSVRFVHVDPDAFYKRQLFAPIVNWVPVKRERLQFINAKVEGQCLGDELLAYYRTSQQAEQDFGVPWYIFRHWFRRSKESILESFAGYIAESGAKSRYKVNWEAFWRAGNASEYVRTEIVRCVPPHMLLQMAHVLPQNLLMVVFDTPESDVRVVERMLEVSGFKPGFVQFSLSPAPWSSAAQQYNVQMLQKLGLRVGIHEGGLDNETVVVAFPARHEPQFSACDDQRPCGPAGSKWLFLQDLLSHAAASAREKQGQGAAPVLLHVGSAGLMAGSQFQGADLWTKVLALLPDELRQSVRIVFVDPSSDHEKKLWEAVKQLPLAATQAQLVNGVVRDTCTSDHAILYRPSRAAERDFGVPYSVYEAWLGPSRQHNLDVLRAYAASYRPDRAAWEQFNNAPNRSDYITNVSVPCLTASTLLARAGTTGAHIAMVVVDADPEDERIVASMLDLPDFRPGLLQYGLLRWGGAENQALFPKLQRHGFEVGRTYHGSDVRDRTSTIAVRH